MELAYATSLFINNDLPSCKLPHPNDSIPKDTWKSQDSFGPFGQEVIQSDLGESLRVPRNYTSCTITITLSKKKKRKKKDGNVTV